MAQQLFSNNAKTTVSGNLAQGGTVLTLASGSGSMFPDPGSVSGGYFIASLFEHDTNGNEVRIENVKVTGRTNDTITIATRDFENMTGQAGGYAYPSQVGATVYFALRYSAYAAGNTLNKDDNLASLGNAATARSNLGIGNIDNTSDADKPISTATQAALSGKATSGNVPVDTHASSSKPTPVDADEIPLSDSAASWGLKKLTWANLKATLAALFAPIASPAFTGIPAAPTAAQGTNTMQIATTNFAIGEFGKHRNLVDNGNFVVAQRGAGPFTITSTDYYTVDRWYAVRAGFVAGALVTRVTATLPTSQVGLKVQRAAGNSDTSVIYLCQPFTTDRIVGVRGKTVTLSFSAKAGANYSGGGTLTAGIACGTGPEGKGIYSGFTGTTFVINTVVAITGSMARFTLTSTAIPTNATQMELIFTYYPTGTAGADDSFTIEEVQIEEGNVATIFEQEAVQVTSLKCRRHLNRLVPSAAVSYLATGKTTATLMYCMYAAPVPMRAVPTTTFSGAFAIEAGGTAAIVTAINIISMSNNVIGFVAAAALPANAAGLLYSNNDLNAYIQFSAEL